MLAGWIDGWMDGWADFLFSILWYYVNKIADGTDVGWGEVDEKGIIKDNPEFLSWENW